jgi:polysaccharide deacetylase family protein (PEP-CTERM system associated)
MATALRIVGLKGELIIQLMQLCRRSLIDIGEPLPAADVQPSTDELEVSLLSFFDEFFHISEWDYQKEPAVPVPKRIQFRSPNAQLAQTGPYKQESSTKKIANCMTVDVEDYFQVSAFADRVTRNDWGRYDCRVEENTNRILNLFDTTNVKGTVFVLGWIAERYPALVRRIAAAGHEIASHGYWHQLVYDLTPEQFAEDVVASRDAIFNACGVEVNSYRAPSFSIVPRSKWALSVLAELGFKYDSSVFPMAGHDRYGDPDAPKQIHRIQTEHGELIESPPTTGYANGIPVPIGGGYFRLFPAKLTQLAIQNVRQRIGPAMFYLHPWELDPDQPRIFKHASRKSQFRHYVGLKKTEGKLRRVLQSNAFDTMTSVVHAVLRTELPAAQQHEPQLKISRRKKPVALPVEVLPKMSSVSPTIHQ